MDVVARPLFTFDNSFVRELDGLYEPWQAATAPDPRLLVLNDALAEELGADPATLRTPEGIAALVGNAVPDGAEPVAQAYAGHQFGGYSPRLGDGRALLLGEVIDAHGRRRDLHLKGSGRTPFARGGDGKAAVGPMLREYVIAEAMHALGIPTTRSLAVVETGEKVARDTILPGAVLARVAASHIRVGTFQYAAAQGDVELVRRLADHAIARHHPQAAAAENRYLALLDAVVDAQATLIARWMLVGFMDAYDPATVFSSIDHGGRYAYGNQPQIAHWNLTRLAEALLPVIDDDTDAAVELATGVLRTFADRYFERSGAGMRAKLGLGDEQPGDGDLLDDLLSLLHDQQVDFTSFFRTLSSSLRDEPVRARALFDEPLAFDVWAARWLSRLAAEGRATPVTADAMDRVNPVYIPRNHLVEEALAAGTDGDLAPFEQLLEVLARPFDERPGLERYTAPAAGGSAGYQTFCGT